MRPDDASREDDELGIEPAMIDRIAQIAAQVSDDDFARVAPPPGLWDRIAAGAVASAPGTAPAPAPAPIEGGPPPATDASVQAAPVVSLDARRRRMNRTMAVTIAAAVVVLAVTGLLLLRGGSSPDGQQLVATAALAPLEPTAATAEVRLVRDDGDLQLELDAHEMAAAPAGHHYELWLLDPASTGAAPVSLGTMSGSTTVPVPADLDVDEFDVVDVSLQSDGQTEHSGHSLLRGTLA